jgi:membrane peptidoglycan carboxypeptidase
MTSVHGIPVTGGSFPAQIWHLFMSSAIGQLEPVEFPEPKHEPEWKEFERGQYGRSFGYYSDPNYVAPATTEETTTAEESPSATPSAQPPAKKKKKKDATPLAPPASNPPPVAPPPPPSTTVPPEAE